MADMEDLAQLLQSLLSNDESDGSDSGSAEAFSGGNAGADDLFGSIDFETILKMGELFSELQKPDKNTMLLTALKPHMRTENQEKLETAMKLIRIMALIPFLKENGLLDKLF